MAIAVPEQRDRQRTPNVLLIVTDQHRLDAMGAVGAYPFRTPNLDRLRSEGVAFGSAFTPIPLCTPARQSLLTGRRPESNGGLWNYDLGPTTRALDPETYSWPRELGRLGYRSQYVGKWHVHPDLDPTHYGYDEYVALDEYEAWRHDAYPGNPLATDWFGEIDDVDVADSRTHWLAGRTIDFIRDAEATDAPWHARIDFLEPHLPCQPVAAFADRFPAAAIPPWRNFADPFINKPYVQRQQLVTWGVEDYTWDDWAPIVARYYAIVAQMDDAIGTILDALDDIGAAEDTIVIYTTDHGDMGGSHRMMDKHFVMYDDVVRVPLLVRWPGRLKAGTVAEAFAYNTLDLAPTLSVLTGISAPPSPHGDPLFEFEDGSLSIGSAIRARRHVVSTYNGQQFGLFTQRMIRTDRWKYVWNPTDVDELYDLVVDPEEFVNRIDDVDCASVLQSLRQSLYEELQSNGDEFVMTDWMRSQLVDGRKLGGGRRYPVEREEDSEHV